MRCAGAPAGRRGDRRQRLSFDICSLSSAYRQWAAVGARRRRITHRLDGYVSTSAASRDYGVIDPDELRKIAAAEDKA
jgi:hypothetical protein